MSSNSSSSSDSESVESGEVDEGQEEQQQTASSPPQQNHLDPTESAEKDDYEEDPQPTPSPSAEPTDEQQQQNDKNSVEQNDIFQQESSSDESEVGKTKPARSSAQNSANSDSDAPQQVEEEEEEAERTGAAAAEGGEAFAATEADLFGDAADLSSSDNEEPKTQNDEGNEQEIGEDEIVGPRMYIEDEEEQERQAPLETVINVEAPRINADLGNQIHFMKFPNFLSVEPRVFDTESYEDEIDEDEVLDEEGRSRLKLKVENTIRWRNAMDDYGNPIKESNAKIVRWSDGTLSLYLGSEIFDVHMQPTVGDHNHLFVRQGQGLQGQAVFRTKLTFRPHSTDTLTHRKMTLSMADRSSKAQKVKVLAEVGNDPETQKQELVRKEEERLRATARREVQQRRIRERAMSRGLSSSFLEPDRDDDSDEGESLAAIKRSYKPGGKEFDRSLRGLKGSDSEDSEEGRSRLQGAKRLESDEERSPDQSLRKKPKVIEDDEEEEEDD